MAKIMRERYLDFVLSASDAPLTNLSCCASLPVATGPVVNSIKNGQSWVNVCSGEEWKARFAVELHEGISWVFEALEGPAGRSSELLCLISYSALDLAQFVIHIQQGFYPHCTHF